MASFLLPIWYINDEHVYADSSMSPHKKAARKSPMTRRTTRQEESIKKKIETPRGDIYDVTTRFIKKGTSLKWGEFFQIFKKLNFHVEEKDEDELKVFKNI